MRTLQEAWDWYRSAAESAKRLTHLAKVWNAFPWNRADEWVQQVESDNVLRYLEAERMQKDAQGVTRELDDLAVLVLFSVFEANVRDLVETQVRPEAAKLVHPALKAAAEDALDAIAEGSFFRVIEFLKTQLDPTLVEPVNQIRRYRNWVAHGRRQLPEGEQLANVQPFEAFQRLTKVLTRLAPPAVVAATEMPEDSPQ